jgi:hypothetical protein
MQDGNDLDEIIAFFPWKISFIFYSRWLIYRAGYSLKRTKGLKIMYDLYINT